ncbi:MAG: LacI family DNA-binding transcriptional regulator [Limnochordia bacterium]
MLTLKKVAELAGVSTTTVSRVLNNTYRNKVSEATRQRVLRIVEEVGYRSSVPARALRQKKTYQYGLVIPSLAFSYMPEVVQGLQLIAAQYDYACLLYITQEDSSYELEIFRVLNSLHVDGVVWMPQPHHEPNLVQALSQKKVVEILNRSGIANLPSVTIDQELGGYLAAKHLLDMGHRRIGAILHPGIHWKQRYAGYHRALREAGQENLSALVYTDMVLWQNGITAFHELYQQDPGITAILAASDDVAAGVIYAARHQGLCVPDDVAVIGFGDNPISRQGEVSISTIRHSKREVGEQAMRLLVALINNEEVKDIVFRPKLIVRQSSSNSLKK